jgi:regulator of cell morphogenesis and NO signaling
MPVTTETRIRDLMLEKPVAARILANYQIDFCGNATRSLEDVCSDRLLSAAVMAHEIESAFARRPDAGRDWAGVPLTELMEHIVAWHHGFLRAELPWAGVMARRVNQKHGSEHEFLRSLETAVLALREELETHLMKEERILFPYIASMEAAASGGPHPGPSCFGTVANPIRMMEFEHDSARETLQILRSLTSDYRTPPGSCVSFRVLYGSLMAIEEDLHVHIALENEVLHPAALELERRLARADFGSVSRSCYTHQL